MPYTQVANLDFNDIKLALKDFLKAQNELTDYDFEGSAISNLLDVLAYNTYYTAFNTNMVVNELFIDSATLRDNVVSIAKQLGYRPKSSTSPTASISFDVTYSNPTTDTELILKKGSGFISSFDNSIYKYIVQKDVLAQVSNNVATFTDVPLREGTMVVNDWIVSSSTPNQRYVLENPNIDTNTISVSVFPSGGSFNEPYLVADNILGIDSTSKIFYLEEIDDGRYEIKFGDGVLGKKLEANTRIVASYISTNGSDSNGVKSFVFQGILENAQGVTPGAYDVSITSSVASAGGEEKETTEKIKFNAPKIYGAQDRAVTSDDYGAIVRNIYPATSDIIIFGGEEQQPPDYGKVFIVLKPSDASYLTSLTKNDIVSKLQKYVVASVEPVIIDPAILHVEMNSKIYYNSLQTDQTPSQIRDKVIGSIQNYVDNSDTEKFKGTFRYSKFIGVIDDADRSINSNLTSLSMRRDFYPQLNSTFFYEVCYQNAFDSDCDDPVLSSTGFRVTEHPTYDVYLEDRDNKIVLYRLDPVTGDKVVLDKEVGDIDYVKGEIMLYNMTIIKGSYFDNRISLTVKPLSNDIKALREMYLDVDIANSSFVAYKE